MSTRTIRIGNESVPIQLAQCRFPGLAFPVLKYKYVFQLKYTEAILSNSTRKPLWFEITNMLVAVFKNKFIVLFVIIFGTLSFPIASKRGWSGDSAAVFNSRLKTFLFSQAGVLFFLCPLTRCLAPAPLKLRPYDAIQMCLLLLLLLFKPTSTKPVGS